MKELYIKKILKALQVYYPDECMSFNDFVRVCYFVLDRKATKYEKITIIAKVSSDWGIADLTTGREARAESIYQAIATGYESKWRLTR